jgi:hypothetical protein
MNMSYLKGVWSDLAFNTGNATAQLVSSLNWRYQKKTGGLKYVSQSAYKSVLVHVAKQLALSTLEGELNSLLPKYEKLVAKKRIEAAREKQAANRQVLIENGEKSTEGFGSITCEGGHQLIARAKDGTKVPEALILSFEDDDPITYKYVDWDNTTGSSTTGAQPTFTTKTVFLVDLTPKISLNSSKNVVLTQVQGRDYTRKELVSGGDLKFNVSGSIVSDQEGVYPTEAVKRFLKIMQYQGIINVNSFSFGTLGVTRIIIQDFSLDSPEYKNIQPYSFSCVAVEPNDAIKLSGDTIAIINDTISTSTWDTWYTAILDKKLAQIAAKTVLNTATSATSSLASAGLDELVPNI